MNNIILAAAAAVILSAPLAFAANSTATLAPMPKPLKTASTLSEQCTALGAQFDKTEAANKTNKNHKEALGMRSEGKRLCTAHKQTEGIKKIESALTMSGVKPMVKG